MCRWTNGQITLSLDEVREVPLCEAAGQFDFACDLLTMVVLTLDGELGGTMILTFDDQNGRELAASLLCRERCTSPEWTELEQSALNETGNILGCAYMNSLTRMVEADLVPSPPYFVQDFGISVLEQALLAQAATCDVATICRTTFHREGKQLNWNVLFVPTEALRTRLISSASN
ncbi:CheC, inhibitor of MCP methylation [Pirellula staleyi DSM 6068]|uniref:CheC, inhibitor of MCP methylation n=1 Tax=Pirellula staleyi (strain ATCC 27377 / DSM 6068 / ICPB 4128) TaxID=530564 RepID=D2QXD6_PIRSD|nr:CheC, inhibitor of MCP methylation [Pirellula staleyi DSM 6068]